MAENLAKSIANSDDPQTVKDGAPAYLIMIDSFIEGDPENPATQRAAADLNTAYAAMFVDEPERQQKMTEKSLRLAGTALCLEFKSLCQLRKLKFDEFEQKLQSLNKKQIAGLYTLGVSWSAWLQFHSSDWNAVAELPKVTALMNAIARIDESYDTGSVHYYLALLNTILPPALGGKTELAKAHFNKAIELSDGKNLMVKVSFAEKYARLIFDKELHDKLLQEVLETSPYLEGFVLANHMAQTRAKELLAGSADYF